LREIAEGKVDAQSIRDSGRRSSDLDDDPFGDPIEPAEGNTSFSS